MTPRYSYECATCGGSVTKDPCRTETMKSQPRAKGKTRRASAVKVEKKFVGLHGWRCQSHGPVSVKRKILKIEAT